MMTEEQKQKLIEMLLENEKKHLENPDLVFNDFRDPMIEAFKNLLKKDEK